MFPYLTFSDGTEVVYSKILEKDGVKTVQTLLQLTPKSAGEMVKLFVDNNILQEVSEQQRNRSFVFREYLDLFVK